MSLRKLNVNGVLFTNNWLETNSDLNPQCKDLFIWMKGCEDLGRCTTKPKATTYTILVQPVLEYVSPVWDPHQITTTRDIEQAQRRAARFANRQT
jgi:hypothetical protein